MAGAVDEGVLNLCVAGMLDVFGGRRDKGAEAQVEGDAPLLQEQKLLSLASCNQACNLYHFFTYRHARKGEG